MLSGGAATVGRYHLAGLFIISGISKSLNPYGFSIKIGEHLSAMGMDFLAPLSTLGGILMPAAELLLGLMLLSGIARRFSAWASCIFMTGFTAFTLWLAIANPVEDCGCFGDFVKMNNWATFTKNLFFLPFAIFLMAGRHIEASKNPSKRRTRITYAALVPLALATAVYSYTYLPPIDPTPFKTGVNIPQAMQPETATETETTLVYRNLNDGTLHEFAINDTTWYDNTRWEYVDTRVTGEPAAEAAIKSIPMFVAGSDGSQSDLSGDILARTGYTLLYVVNDYDPQLEADMISLARYALRHDTRVVALSSTPLPPSLEAAGIECLGSDHTILRTIVQHRTGGALMVDHGTIIAKWAMNDLPRWNESTGQSANDPLANLMTNVRLHNEWVLTMLFGVLIALVAIFAIRPSGRRLSLMRSLRMMNDMRTMIGSRFSPPGGPIATGTSVQDDSSAPAPDPGTRGEPNTGKKP